MTVLLCILGIATAFILFVVIAHKGWLGNKCQKFAEDVCQAAEDSALRLGDSYRDDD